MPTIRITEKDYTTPGTEAYSNFSVVIPGFYSTDKAKIPAVFDDNGIYECNSPADFLENIGAVAPYTVTRKLQLSETGEPEDVSFISYGNQIAYELLSLGYTILYVNLGPASTSDTSEKATKLMAGLYDGSIFEPLKDKANYDFRFIITGITNDFTKDSQPIEGSCNKLSNNILKIAAFDNDAEKIQETGRGDCFAVIDINEDAYTGKYDEETGEYTKATLTQKEVIDAIKNESISLKLSGDISKYATLIAPTLCFSNLASAKVDKYKSGTEKTVNEKLPASFYYLACFAHSVRDLEFAEWYAIAGLTRGVSTLRVSKTSVKLGEAAIAALEPRKAELLSPASEEVKVWFANAVNVIATFRNRFVLWGNRTSYDLGTGESDDLIASHFLNIRQLCCTIKKEIYQACRRFTFDPNSDVLWINFCNAIRPTLEAMKADQGIEDYEIIKVATSKKATLKARVRVVPIEAVEDFDIEVSLEDALGDTNITVSE